MNEQTSNDNQAARALSVTLPEPDAHGQAAMLLSESILHGLIARSVITVADAIEIIAVATDVQGEIDTDRGDSFVTNRRSLDLLSAIQQSLDYDTPND